MKLSERMRYMRAKSFTTTQVNNNKWDSICDEVVQLEAENEKAQVQDGEAAGDYVARRIMDIFQEVAEHVGNGIFELDHPAPIIRGSIAMTNAWWNYLDSLKGNDDE